MQSSFRYPNNQSEDSKARWTPPALPTPLPTNLRTPLLPPTKKNKTREAITFSQEVKIEKFVSNAGNATNTHARNVKRNLLRVMIMFELVKIESFKDYLDISWVIEEYLSIITHSKSFYFIDIYIFLFVFSSSNKYIKLFIHFFSIFCVFLEHLNFALECARQSPKNRDICSDGLL